MLAGRVAGVLYLTAAASVLLMLAVPGPEFTHPWVVWVAAAISVAWGAAALLVVPWDRAPVAVSHLSTLGGFALVALVAGGTGGATSPARHFLIFIVVYTALFYPAREAIPYLVGCAGVRALPLLYDTGAVQEGIVHDLLATIPSYVVVGGAIVIGHRVIARIASEQRRLAEEQASLRKVATLVAAGSHPQALFALVANEIRRLLGSDAAGVVKFAPAGDAIVLASAAHGAPPVEPGTSLDFSQRPELAHVRDTGRPCRIDDGPGSNRPYQSRVCVPFFVEGRLWGGLCLGARADRSLKPAAEERLVQFAELLSVAIANTEDRERLVFEAGRDILTGVGNHRSFAGRLEAEVGRAKRHGGDVALAVIDIDRFRLLNQRVGHDVADRVLAELARTIGEETRAEDVVARVHGDEFAVIMPGIDRRSAVVVTERLRQRVAGSVFAEGTTFTICAGISDLTTAAGDADTLVRFANGALYWAKAHGRNSSWIYDPAVVRSLSAHEHAEYLERSQGLVGLQALARAIDAKDPTTRQHSERVAELTERLARDLGWPARRATRLREAALVHDVGKIGVPDAILLKPSRLTLDEYETVKDHAVLSAQIVEGVLTDEQAGWVRAHHERPDGGGYPDGLAGSEIPDGALIIALADSWDVMTAPRLYSEPMEPGAALEECISLVGAQFDADCVAALERLYRRGRLGLAPAGELAGVTP